MELTVKDKAGNILFESGDVGSLEWNNVGPTVTIIAEQPDEVPDTQPRAAPPPRSDPTPYKTPRRPRP